VDEPWHRDEPDLHWCRRALVPRWRPEPANAPVYDAGVQSDGTASDCQGVHPAPADRLWHAALAPTDLAPGADGGATLTKTSSGWRIELDAAGLPRLDSGRFYEAWLKNDAGALVPIGTFNEGQNVTLWAGVSPVDFPTLTVTREEADGDQASSGEKVLVGTVNTGG